MLLDSFQIYMPGANCLVDNVINVQLSAISILRVEVLLTCPLTALFGSVANRTLSNAIEIPQMRRHISDKPCRISLPFGQTLIHGDISYRRCCTNPRRNVIFRTDVYVAHHLERHARHRVISVRDTVIVTFCGGLIGDILRC